MQLFRNDTRKFAILAAVLVLPLWFLSPQSKAQSFKALAAWTKINYAEIHMHIPRWEVGADYVFEIDRNLDLAYQLNIRGDPGSSFKGRVMVIADRIMLTKGIVSKKGEERIPLDLANLDFQLVLEILSRAFPKGPGKISRATTRSGKTRSKGLLVEVGDGEILYGKPWHYDATVAPKSSGGLKFEIDFAYTQDGKRYGEEIKLSGLLKRKRPSPRFSGSMDLTDWKLYRLKLGRVYAIKAKYKNLGELRKKVAK